MQAAGAQRVNLSDGVNEDFSNFGFWVWPVEPVPLGPRLTSDVHSRIETARDADPGIALVILEQDIVARLEFLDQGILQVEGLFLGIDDSVFQVSNIAHKHSCAQRCVFAVEVGAHTALEVLGLADVYNRALPIAVAINARLIGEQRQLQLQVVGHASNSINAPNDQAQSQKVNSEVTSTSGGKTSRPCRSARSQMKLM